MYHPMRFAESGWNGVLVFVNVLRIEGGWRLDDDSFLSTVLLSSSSHHAVGAQHAHAGPEKEKRCGIVLHSFVVAVIFLSKDRERERKKEVRFLWKRSARGSGFSSLSGRRTLNRFETLNPKPVCFLSIFSPSVCFRNERSTMTTRTHRRRR